MKLQFQYFLAAFCIYLGRVLFSACLLSDPCGNNPLDYSSVASTRPLLGALVWPAPRHTDWAILTQLSSSMTTEDNQSIMSKIKRSRGTHNGMGVAKE